MPSFLCESSPTGQYTSYVPTLRVRVSVAVEPGWMSSVSRSMPCPSTSKPCGMLPALVTVKETGPAAILASDSSTFHSESLAVTAAGVPGARCAAVVASATRASKAKATLRDGTASVVLMAIFLLRAFRHCGSFRGAGSGEGRAWLLAIVRNTAYTWQRRHHGDTLTTEFDEEQHSEAATGEDPETAVVAQGERVALHRAIDELPPEFREVIVLRELEELSYKEIAEVAGVPVGTVMSRLSRARRRLEMLCAQTEDC